MKCRDVDSAAWAFTHAALYLHTYQSRNPINTIMNKTILQNIAVSTFVALALLLAGVSFVAAQEETEEESTETTQIETRGDMRAAMEERRAELQGEMEERREDMEERRAEMQTQMEERRAELSARAAERITNLAANVSNKMDTAAARLQDIIDRLNSRIDKLAEAGLDTTEAEAAMASAQVSVNTAVNELASIDAVVQAAISSDTPRESWVEVKATYQSIREQLRTAHTEIKAAVAALKAAAQAIEDGRGASAAVRNDNADQSDDSDESEEEGEDVTSEAEADASDE